MATCVEKSRLIQGRCFALLYLEPLGMRRDCTREVAWACLGRRIERLVKG